jgi:fatty acid desaturase
MAALKIIKKRGKVPLLARFAWRSWVPLAGLSQHFVFWTYPLVMLKSGEMNRKIFIQSVISILYIPLVYIVLHSIFPAYVNWGNVWPSLLIYLVLVELVNLPHHSDMPYFDSTSSIKKLHAWEQEKTTRSCYYPYYLSEILALNFNFHTEHHYFPSLPWYRLRKLRNILKPALDKEYSELYGIGWNIENRKRNPDEIFLANKKIV